MHEFLLFGQVSGDDYRKVLQQLAGMTRMHPVSCKEVHLVFKARPPITGPLPSTAGGSQDISKQDVQQARALLSGTLFYLQLVGELHDSSAADDHLNDKQAHPEPTVDGHIDVPMTNGQFGNLEPPSKLRWRLEFRDIPDAGKQSVCVRLMSSFSLDGSDLLQFLSNVGYEYVSQYLIVGSKFYDQETTLFLHRVLQQPPQTVEELFGPDFSFPPTEDLAPLDGTGGWVLQGSIEAVDGTNTELKDRATRQLLAMKETLKESVNLVPGDRLALDTRLPVSSVR